VPPAPAPIGATWEHAANIASTIVATTMRWMTVLRAIG
jgi:hypothetical protein